MPNKVVGIILAGGSGNRFEADVPKQFCLLNGGMVLEHSIRAFRKSGLFSKIILVLSPEWLDNPLAALGDVNVACGQNRNESTWNALQACDPDTDLVLIHDAARPFVSGDILSACIAALREHAAVDVCIPADDTIVQVQDGFIESIPDRSRLMRGQTPQGFWFPQIYQAYRDNLDKLTATDDVGIYLRSGGRCKVVMGSAFNIKLTYPQDLFVAERILQYRPAQSNAKFALAGKRVLLLGGSGGIGSSVREMLCAEGADVTAPTRQDWNLARPGIPANYLRHWDVIIHAAGVLTGASNADGIEEIFAVNFRSVIAITDLARKCMNGGAIVVVGSSSAMQGREGFPIYAASKAAVNNFIEGIAAILWREREVRINCVNPGCVNTRMIIGAPVTNRNPLAPDVVAEAILTYAAPAETGQIINVRKHMH